MIVTVFRNRLNQEAAEEYYPVAERMSELAQTMPGYISHKTFAGEDGERVTIVEFETMAETRNWGLHAEHREAQRLGRERFYTEYSIQVCEVKRGRGAD